MNFDELAKRLFNNIEVGDRVESINNPFITPELPGTVTYINREEGWASVLFDDGKEFTITFDLYLKLLWTY